MKRILKARFSIILIALAIFTHCAYGQDENIENIYKEEKFTIGFGLGADYSLIGAKYKFKLKNSLFLIASNSFIISPMGNIGLEYHRPKNKNLGICPYYFFTVGSDLHVNLTSWRNESKNFNSLNLGLGLKIQVMRSLNGYFSLGMSYRFYPEEKVDIYVIDYNRRNQSERSANIQRRMISVAYNFIIDTKSMK